MRITTLMCNKRIRDIDPKESSQSGRFVSYKQKKRVIEFESGLEQDFIHLLEFDSNVSKYIEQPFMIPYELNGRSRNYIPDFYVEYIEEGRIPDLFEIKYADEVEESSDILEAKIAAAQEWCRNANMNYRVVTEKEIRENPVYLNNIKLLGHYVNSLDPYMLHNSLNFDDEHCLGIFNHIKKNGHKSIDEFVRGYSEDEEIRYEAFFHIFYMLSTKRLQTDLLIPLNKNSIVWL
jgi:hypothetical protein